MLRVAAVAAAVACAALAASAEEPRPPPKGSIAVMELSSPSDFTDKAKGLSSVIATRLAGHPGAKVIGFDEVRATLGLEKTRQQLGCSDDSCLAEISGALGVRYVVHGRVDRFGNTLLLNAFVFDALAAKSVTRWSENVADDAQLPVQAERFADHAALALGLPHGDLPLLPAPFTPTVSFNLKLGNTYQSLKGASLSAFQARFDLEGDYYLTRAWQLYLQAGMVVGSASDATTSSQSFQFIPIGLGTKYTFRAAELVRPYVGLGLGAKIIGKLLHPSDSGKVGFDTVALAGLAFFPWQRVGLNLELSGNLAAIAVQDDSGVKLAFNTNFGLITAF